MTTEVKRNVAKQDDSTIYFIWSYLVYIWMCYLPLHGVFLLILSWAVSDNGQDSVIPFFFDLILPITISTYTLAVILSIKIIVKLRSNEELSKEKRKSWIYHMIFYNGFANATYYEAFILDKKRRRGIIELSLKEIADKLNAWNWSPPPV